MSPLLSNRAVQTSCHAFFILVMAGGCALAPQGTVPSEPTNVVVIANAFPDGTVSKLTPLPTEWPCTALHCDESRAGGYRFSIAENGETTDQLVCILDRGNGKRGWQYYPADIEEKLLADLHDDMRHYVEEHRYQAKAGFYPDGTKMGGVCLVLTVEACLVDYFLREIGIAEELDTAAIKSEQHLLIDVRGETERKNNPLPDNLKHRIVQYGFDTHDPLALTELDREAFVESIAEVRGDDPRPLALLCTAGVRSRTAAVALKASGINDVASIHGGLQRALPASFPTIN